MKYLFDTNAVIDFLGSEPPLKLRRLITSSLIQISAKTYIELLSQSDLKPYERVKIDAFVGKCNVVFDTLNAEIIELSAQIRRNHSLHLPDAIIAATAMANELVLVTSDWAFQKVAGLEMVNHRTM